MAFTLVQTVTGGNFASAAYNISLTGVTSGNTLIVFIGAANTISTPSDGANTYTAVGASLNYVSSNNTNIYYAKNVTGGNLTLAISLGGVVGSSVTVREYSGLDLNLPFDKTAQAAGTGTPSSGATGVTAAADELVVGSVSINSSYSGSAGSGFGNYLDNNTSTTATMGVEDMTVAAIGAQTATFGTSSIFNWGCIVATFRGPIPKPSFQTNKLRPHAFSPGLAR